VGEPLLVRVRRATADDASDIVTIWQGIAAERIYSAIDQPWTIDQEYTYLSSLSPREATHVAVEEGGRIVGFQSLDLWARTINSMSHVGQVGTHLLPDWRRRGVGRALFTATHAFARESAYSKLVILVRASNESAQRFYTGLGFRECGRLGRQVRIDGRDEDEIVMELFLD
jgi:ribosomal protein S18 acetylase RimI-like enzyme